MSLIEHGRCNIEFEIFLNNNILSVHFNITFKNTYIYMDQ